MSDISEVYIMMCDHPKIQGQWKLKNGDKRVFSITRVISINNIDEDEKYYSPKKIKTIKKYNLWLPLPHQIHEMLEIKDVDDYFGMIYKMFFERHENVLFDTLPSWRVIDYDSGERFSTPDQLLLGYYMHEKHGLIWENDKWVKE